MENATVPTAVAGMRECNPAWRNRDLPPSPQLAYTHSKVCSWLDRNPKGVDETRMDKERGHTFLMQAVIANNEELVAELILRRLAMSNATFNTEDAVRSGLVAVGASADGRSINVSETCVATATAAGRWEACSCLCPTLTHTQFRC